MDKILEHLFKSTLKTWHSLVVTKIIKSRYCPLQLHYRLLFRLNAFSSVDMFFTLWGFGNATCWRTGTFCRDVASVWSKAAGLIWSPARGRRAETHLPALPGLFEVHLSRTKSHCLYFSVFHGGTIEGSRGAMFGAHCPPLRHPTALIDALSVHVCPR